MEENDICKFFKRVEEFNLNEDSEWERLIKFF